VVLAVHISVVAIVLALEVACRSVASASASAHFISYLTVQLTAFTLQSKLLVAELSHD
jgi:hypothetical protein